MALGNLIDNVPLMNKPSKLKIGHELNRGAYGVVYEGTLAGQQVAVKGVHKMLLEAEGGENALRRFCEECERLKELEHPHVIKFLGAFKDAKLGPILVMERMNETLRHFLERQQGKLTVQEQIRISHEITQGVAFLHQLTPPMVHRDLNDKNVMFAFDGVAKIGDFGQSRLKQDLYLTSVQPGMVMFMPPEALSVGNSKYDESLDMFSLGVLMLEIGTQQLPLVNMVGIGIVPEVRRREKDLGSMDNLHPLKQHVVLCLSDEQKQRPKATELQCILRTLIAGEERFRRMEAEVASRDDKIRQLEESCKQLVAQAEVASRDAMIRQLEERCELLTAQATTYKLDFRQERSDREKAMGRFVRERREFQLRIAELNKRMKAMHLEHEDSLAQLRQLKELSSPHENELIAHKEDSTAPEKCEALLTRSHSRQVIKVKEQTDQSADISHEHGNDVLALAKLSAALEFMQNDNTKEKHKKLFRDTSREDLKRSSLKRDFETIVRNKDKEILMQIEEIQQLNQHVETIEYLLSEKCSRVRALEIEMRQLRELYGVPHQDDPSWEHSVKDNGATAIEHSAVLPKQACSNTAVDLEEQHPRHHIKVQTSLLEADAEKDTAAITQDDPSWEHSVKDNGATAIEHSAFLPKQARSNTAVEKQHQHHHIKVQTSLLEADGEKDTAAITEFRTMPTMVEWDIQREIEFELTTRAATAQSAKATSRVCSMQD